MSSDVFISHSSEDRTIAETICAHLESRNVRCWLAPRDVPPGAIWAEAIIEAIEHCRVMVLVLTARANASHQVIQEVERAVNKGVVIIPFRVQNVPLSRGLEYFISNRHWLDALTPPLEQHIRVLADRVLQLLHRDAPELPSPVIAPAAPLPGPAPIPATRRGISPRAIALGSAAAIVLALLLFWWLWRDPENSAPAATAPTLQPPLVGEVPPSASRAEDARSEGTSRSAPSDPAPIEFGVLLPDTSWAGALNAGGAARECLFNVDRRVNDRLYLSIYFPEAGANQLRRWTGQLRAPEVIMEGATDTRERVTLTGRVQATTYTGSWRDDAGQQGDFGFELITEQAELVVPDTTWRGTLTTTTGDAGRSEPMQIHIQNRTRERISGRGSLADQRTEAGMSGVLLGDRFFGTLNNFLVRGTQRIDVRFSATVRAQAITGTWTSDSGLGGSLEWVRQ